MFKICNKRWKLFWGLICTRNLRLWSVGAPLTFSSLDNIDLSCQFKVQTLSIWTIHCTFYHVGQVLHLEFELVPWKLLWKGKKSIDLVNRPAACRKLTSLRAFVLCDHNYIIFKNLKGSNQKRKSIFRGQVIFEQHLYTTHELDKMGPKSFWFRIWILIPFNFQYLLFLHFFLRWSRIS